MQCIAYFEELELNYSYYLLVSIIILDIEHLLSVMDYDSYLWIMIHIYGL